MADKNTANAINLFILGISIILIVIVYQNLYKSKSDLFVGKLPIVGGGPNPPLQPGTYPYGQPQMYSQQYYPAKYPYYDDTLNQYNKPCDKQNGCGVLGACKNGICTIKNENNLISQYIID